MRKWVEFVVIGAENHQYDWTPWNLSRRGRILCRISEGLVCPEQCWEHRDGPASFPVIPSCPLSWIGVTGALPCPAQGKAPTGNSGALVALTAGRDTEGHQWIHFDVGCMLQKLIVAGEWQGQADEQLQQVGLANFIRSGSCLCLVWKQSRDLCTHLFKNFCANLWGGDGSTLHKLCVWGVQQVILLQRGCSGEHTGKVPKGPCPSCWKSCHCWKAALCFSQCCDS